MPGKRKTRAAASVKTTDSGTGLMLDVSKLTIEELRAQLLDIGEDPGPIDSSNRHMYDRMLTRKKLKIETETSLTTSPPSANTSLTRSPISLARSTAGSDPRSPPKARAPRTVKPAAARPSKPVKPLPKDLSSFTIEGLMAATFTPFNDNGDVNLSVIPKYADHLIQSGVVNIFVNGTTGESLTLTVEERKLLASEWIRVSQGRLTVIVHVGTESLKDTCELAAHAVAIGADGIGVQPTTFFKPASIEHLVCYLEKVAEASPSLPMYYYHIPSVTGVKLPMEDFLDIASTRLSTLRGLKYTDSDLMSFSRCVTSHGGKFQILYGSDQQVLGALCLGGVAAIGSTYNYAGKLNNRLFSAFKCNNLDGARLEQRRSQALIKILHKYEGGNAASGKEFLRLAAGVDCGPPRLPTLPLSHDTAKNLQTDLQDIGFFAWA